MNITVTFETILGMMLGIEFADKDVLEAYEGMKWGISISLFIICITVSNWEEE